MKHFVTSGVLALAVTLTGLAPGFAAPLSVPLAPQAAPAPVQQVDLTVRGGVYFYNGRRGSRRYHRGWRRHHGWYFPPSAFYYSPRHYYYPRHYRDYRRDYRRGFSRAHYRWCDNRYRSYRAYDNTFQPYNGPRRQCYSPYS